MSYDFTQGTSLTDFQGNYAEKSAKIKKNVEDYLSKMPLGFLLWICRTFQHNVAVVLRLKKVYFKGLSQSALLKIFFCFKFHHKTLTMHLNALEFWSQHYSAFCNILYIYFYLCMLYVYIFICSFTVRLAAANLVIHCIMTIKNLDSDSDLHLLRLPPDFTSCFQNNYAYGDLYNMQ